MLPYDLPPDFPLTISPWKIQARELQWMHAHNVLEIGYCNQGKGLFVIEEQAHPFEPGDVFVINPREFHHAHSIDGKECRWHFIFLDLAKLISRTFFDSGTMRTKQFFRQFGGHRFRPGSHPAFCASVQSVVSEFERKKPFYREALLAMTLAMTVELARTVRREKKPLRSGYGFDHRIVKALRLMARDYRSPPDLASLARSSGLSVPHFRRRFKALMGQTPMDYLRAIRISHVMHALTDTDKTIAEIAFEHGFESLSSFNRQFRARLELNPSQWRKENEFRSSHKAASE